MAIKTLLVHLAPDPDCDNRLKVAVGLASKLDAHLLALYVATPVHLPPGAEGRGASALYLQEARERAREKSTAIKSRVEEVCAAANVSHEWIYGEEDHLDTLLDEVHHVDMTVVNQVGFDSFEDRLMYQMPEKLVMGAGGPVLVIPKGMTEFDLDTVGTILVAWTYSKEAIRALRDSLPMLTKAKSVHLLTCGSDRQVASESANRVVDYLKRHGVEVSQISQAQSGHAGEEILLTAEAVKAEMVVMGAYGHTSFLDKLFGSASRYVIGHTHIPLLMSH
ncbi:MAG: universal stress protein [Alphaproteobacteria bacterium]|nr:universal stress protein [Alphaproteobacteria bacterium]